jgi:hypothetical protein
MSQHELLRFAARRPAAARKDLYSYVPGTSVPGYRLWRPLRGLEWEQDKIIPHDKAIFRTRSLTQKRAGAKAQDIKDADGMAEAMP